MINEKEKGLVYLIQPAELVGTSRYKIGYSKNSDLDKFRRDYKKGSRFLDIYEYDKTPLLVREIRSNFNNKFKLVAGHSYYEGNENDIKKRFSDIINNYSSVNNIISRNLITNANTNTNVSSTNIDTRVIPYTNKNTNNNMSSYKPNKLISNDYMSNYTYIHKIMYGSNCEKMKHYDKYPNTATKSYYEDVISNPYYNYK
jgi:hypothetical protein